MRVSISFIFENTSYYFRRFLSRYGGIYLNRRCYRFIFVESRRDMNICVDVYDVISCGIAVP